MLSMIAYLRACHRLYHQPVLSSLTPADLEMAHKVLREMDTEELIGYVGSWTCPDRTNCGWLKWLESEHANL
jgi:hypothetical protein